MIDTNDENIYRIIWKIKNVEIDEIIYFLYYLNDNNEINYWNINNFFDKEIIAYLNKNEKIHEKWYNYNDFLWINFKIIKKKYKSFYDIIDLVFEKKEKIILLWNYEMNNFYLKKIKVDGVHNFKYEIYKQDAGTCYLNSCIIDII